VSSDRNTDNVFQSSHRPSKLFLTGITESNSALHQKSQRANVKANGNDNFKHSLLLFSAKIEPACAKPLHKQKETVNFCIFVSKFSE
jgi:hypothetical protein